MAQPVLDTGTGITISGKVVPFRQGAVWSGAQHTITSSYYGGGGGGDGGSGMVEARVDRIETQIDRIDDRIRGVEVGVATLVERVSHLPSKGFIVTVILATMAVFSGLVVFKDQIVAIFG